MQKLTKLSLLVLVLMGFQTLSASGIEWEHSSWKEALAKAKKENKYIFLDAYTTWCGPCKWMSANVTNQEEVGEFYNKNFVSVKMDMEAGEGIEVAKKYRIQVYPSLLFIDGDGRIVHRTAGALPVDQFLGLGQQVLDMEEPFYAMQETYERGKYDREFEFKYLMYLADAFQPLDDVLAHYAKGISPDNLMEPNHWAVFNRLYHSVDTDEFKHFEQNLDQFKQKFGEEEVEQKYTRNYLRSLNMAVRSEDWDAFDKLAAQIEAMNNEGLEEGLMDMRVLRAKETMPLEEFARQLTTWVGEDKPVSANTLNSYAWQVYTGVDDPKIVKMAIKWVEASVEKEPGYANVDTYAMLLKKSGDIDGAIVQAKRAIELAEDAGEDYSETQKELENMREMVKN